jgi:putative aldouronate transport system substrate-binding protein
MKKRYLKFIALIIIVCLTLSISIGCSTSEVAKEKEESKSPSPTTTSGEKVKLTYFTVLPPGHAAVHQTINDMPSMQAIQEATNIELEMICVPTANYDERKNLLFASADLPDLVYSNNASYDALMYGVNDNLLIPLDDLIKKHAPNFVEWVTFEPAIREQSLSTDGKQYFMPYTDTTLANIVQVGYYVREAWLEELSLEAPNTLEDFYNVLKKFKEADLAGGENTLPLSAQSPGNIVNPILGAFGVSSGIYQVNGKIKYGPMEPEYRETLIYVNQLYKEGLIASDYLSHDANIYNANLIENIGITFAWSGSGLRTPLQASGQTITQVRDEWRPIGGMKGPDGKHYWFSTPMGKVTNNLGVFVTSANKYPAEAMHFLDYTYSQEGAYTLVAGPKGQCWDFDENGVFYVTDHVLKNPNNLQPDEVLLQAGGMVWAFHIGICGISRVNPSNRWPYPYDDINYARNLYGPEPDSLYSRNLKNWFDVTAERQLPPTITYTSEEQEKINLLYQDISVLVEENLHKVIMGLEPITKWDQVLSQLKQMNVDEYISLHQDALDRVNN